MSFKRKFKRFIKTHGHLSKISKIILGVFIFIVLLFDIYELFLTPRIDLVACGVNESLENISVMFRDSGYSRIPCYEGTIDNIIGVLHEKDFYYLFYNNALEWPIAV